MGEWVLKAVGGPLWHFFFIISAFRFSYIFFTTRRELPSNWVVSICYVKNVEGVSFSILFLKF